MPKRANQDAVDAARHLLVDYYESGRRRHTYESIARRTGLSRATVGRLAAEVRDALPSLSALEQRIDALEMNVAALEQMLRRRMMLRDVA